MFVKSEHQLTDILTKGLSAKAFEDILYKIVLFDLYNPNPNLMGNIKKYFFLLVSEIVHHRLLITLGYSFIFFLQL
jgi:hypothetical protein